MKEMKVTLLHLSRNMWREWPLDPKSDAGLDKRAPDREMTLNEDIWRRAVDLAAAKGIRQLMIDVGDAVTFPSHPELAIRGSWTPERLQAELARIRKLGMEPIPKLNFSNTHSGWLKEYRYMVSTPDYYRVCADVIRDIAELFGHPQFLHLGYDEETFAHQSRFDFAVVRQGELWWHDFLWFVATVERAGMRAWVWSDYGWHHPEYVTRCPKSVMQSNWYYDEVMEGFDIPRMKSHAAFVQLFLDLDKAGFEQIPCGSNWNSSYRKKHGPPRNESMRELVAFCRKNLSPALLKGFMMAPWAMCVKEEELERIREGLDLFGGLVA